jgi:hypothetical protein
MILDEEGALVWFQQAPPGDVAMNFQVERYEGKPVLAWWQGTITHLGIGFGVDELYSSSYQPIAQIAAGNGYQADLHDLQITPAGSAFITRTRSSAPTSPRSVDPATGRWWIRFCRR